MTQLEIPSNGTRASVHIVLQGKGGVGKSFVSAILAQYFRTKAASVHCLDTDPVNATLAQYRVLEAEHLKVLRRGTVNEKQFDTLVQKVCHGEGVFIVDTGATTFVPLWNYILENEILAFFRDHNRNAFVHSVVTGGQAMSDTLNGLERLAQTTSDKNVIVWLNEYFGEIVKEGKPFEEFKVAEEYATKLVGTVVIRERNPHTYGDDVRMMLERRLTFDEAIRNEEFSLVSKQRLAIVRREIFEQTRPLGNSVAQMPSQTDFIDVQQLIAEVATRHDLLLRPSDPAIALVTMNQLILERSLKIVHEHVDATIAKFDASVQKAEKRAGTVLAQEVKESATQMRQGLQTDIRNAGLKSLEFVHAVNEANLRPARIRWWAAGLIAGAALFGSGIWVGILLR